MICAGTPQMDREAAIPLLTAASTQPALITLYV
jgi:hypothetical protein